MSVSIVFHANCLDASLSAFMLSKVADLLQVRYKLSPANGQNQFKEESSHSTVLIDLPISVSQIEMYYPDSSSVVVFDRKESTAEMLGGTGFYDIRLRTGGRLTVFNDGVTPSCKNMHATLRSKAGVKLLLRRGVADLEKTVVNNVLDIPRILSWIDAVGQKDMRKSPTEDQLSICSLLSKERFLNRGFERLLQMSNQEYDMALHTELCAHMAKREEGAFYVANCVKFYLPTGEAEGTKICATEAPGNLNTEVTQQMLHKFNDVDVAMAYHFNHKKHTYCAQFRASHNLSPKNMEKSLQLVHKTLNFIHNESDGNATFSVKTEDSKSSIVFMNEEMLNSLTGDFFGLETMQ